MQFVRWFSYFDQFNHHGDQIHLFGVLNYNRLANSSDEEDFLKLFNKLQDNGVIIWAQRLISTYMSD